MTLQQVLDQGLFAYKQKHKLPLHYHKALSSLSRCRTASMGGHVQRCEHGHIEGVWYNSCKYRLCPQCNGIQGERWLRSQKSRLLACSHRHIIFTIPHEFNNLWRYNTALIMDILFKTVRDTLMVLCADPQYLGAEPGILCALHTWGRSLSLHPHIHCLITEGGTTEHGGWKTPKRNCFLPARVVMYLFRGKFLGALREAQACGKLKIMPDMRLNQWQSLLNKLGRKKWNVNVRERYAHGRGVTTYLARYVRGGPLKNSQLTHIDTEKVTFRYYAHQEDAQGAKNKRMEMMLSHENFISRYLNHIPPQGKAMIRSYGFYSNSKRDQLNRIREHFDQPPVKPPAFLTWQAYYYQLNNNHPPTRCTQCGAALMAIKVTAERWARSKDPPLSIKLG